MFVFYCITCWVERRASVRLVLLDLVFNEDHSAMECPLCGDNAFNVCQEVE